MVSAGKIGLQLELDVQDLAGLALSADDLIGQVIVASPQGLAALIFKGSLA